MTGTYNGTNFIKEVTARLSYNLHDICEYAVRSIHTLCVLKLSQSISPVQRDMERRDSI